MSSLGYIGAGGYTYWEFTAIKPGIDTVFIQNCFVGTGRKPCKDYSKDTMDVDYKVIFTVE